ncbi:MAG: pyruvate, phosphate dikinase [Bacteroidetes bacterium]|nr:pyruvate, phosphate dikinase [Bacteroidota bacterium]
MQRFLNKSNFNRDIYHDLMPFKVKEILLVGNLYDAYSIEKDGRFSEHVLGEYSQLNLTSLPRISGVSTIEEVLNELNSKHYDLIIFMLGVDKKAPIEMSKIIKEKYQYIPIFLLLNSNRDLEIYQSAELPSIDKVFVWNGDSKIFFAMIKIVEDKINIENDTKIGLVRVIVLVEDSAKYYSKYLPLLYKIVLEQTRRVIDDVSTDELYKLLKLKARPKIILASNYEDAINIIRQYQDYMLCMITDVKFPKDNILDENAGLKLVKYVRENMKFIPTIIQSSEEENSKIAFELKSTFINKNSDYLLQEIKSFITHYLGFGNFIYRNQNGHQIAVAKSLKEFEKKIQEIPAESLLHHAKKNHFSTWLMARGEIQVAKILNPSKVSDFDSPDDLREYLSSVIKKFRNEQNLGKIIPFEESLISDETNIVSLSDGSLGGKGRGLAFVNTLIYNFDFSKNVQGINIKTPKTSIIGTEEFEYFRERNSIDTFVKKNTSYNDIRKYFAKSRLSTSLIKRLKSILKHIKTPIAIRSSGLFEDSLTQPFAGIFETYILPNNHSDIKVRLEQCKTAIKLVYASVYSERARAYIEAINYKIDEEKMAVVIQEVVGNQFGDTYYPHISGVAESYNYYPFSHIKPEDGFALTAVGLGRYVVEGEKAFRFCPKFSTLEINSPKDQYKNSQVHFYAVDLKNSDVNLMKGEDAGLVKMDIFEAEKHNSLRHCVSTYNADNETIEPGIDSYGPRVVNFANILKYDYIPLAKTIEIVLGLVKEALGSPVEIEFAVDLKKDKNGKASFYLLQIKPLIGTSLDYSINVDEIDKNKVVLFANKAMGNGLIENICDVIFVDKEKFDKSKTEEMVLEIEAINKKMISEKRNYVLIGPGRWGTRDKWIGIPVSWPQISNAKIIVETSLKDYPLEASSGSHFFHNVTSMNVGYFSIQQEHSEDILKWDVLKKQKLIDETKYFKHVQFENPLKIMMDGKKRISVILE